MRRHLTPRITARATTMTRCFRLRGVAARVAPGAPCPPWRRRQRLARDVYMRVADLPRRARARHLSAAPARAEEAVATPSEGTPWPADAAAHGQTAHREHPAAGWESEEVSPMRSALDTARPRLVGVGQLCAQMRKAYFPLPKPFGLHLQASAQPGWKAPVALEHCTMTCRIDTVQPEEGPEAHCAYAVRYEFPVKTLIILVAIVITLRVIVIIVVTLTILVVRLPRRPLDHARGEGGQ